MDNIQDKIKRLTTLGIPYYQAIAIVNSESPLPKMVVGGEWEEDFFKNVMNQYPIEYTDFTQTSNPFETGYLGFSGNTIGRVMKQEDTTKNTELDLTKANEIKKLFNPYAGFDTEMSAHLLGRSLAGDATASQGVGAGLKLATGLARNLFSGIGEGKVNQYLKKQYKERQRRGLVDNYQAGGEVTSDEIYDATGIRFSEEEANRLFELRPPRTHVHSKRDTLNLGNFKDRRYFNIHDQDTNVRFIPTKENPQNYQGYKNQVEYLQKLNPNINIDRSAYARFEDREYYKQDGGNISFPERMTGEYIEGLPDNMAHEAIVEVEDGEHMLQPDGTMSEVKGRKHSQGGEKLSPEQVQDGTIVVSDHLKIGKDNAKLFSERYGIKVKASDTYATVVDKVKDKTGLKKLNKEYEQIIKEIEKQEKNTSDTTTKNLNLEFLSGKIQELEQEKAIIEEQVKGALSEVYEVQEATKLQEEVGTDQLDFEAIAEIARQNGIPEEQAMEIVQEYMRGGSIQKMQEGNKVNNPYYVLTVSTKNGKPVYIDTITGKEVENIGEYYEDNEEEVIEDTSGFEKGQPNQQDGFKKGEEVQEQSEYNYWQDRLKGILSQPYVDPNLNLGEYNFNRFNTDDIDEEVGERDTETEQDYFMFPDQSVLPPTSPRPPLKTELRLGRADAYRIDPSRALEQNQRNFDAQMEQLGSLPPSQRQAAQAALLAEKNAADSQIINTTATQNAQIMAEADRYNIQKSDLEAQEALRSALDYEKRMFGTLNAYENSLDAYYNYMRELNVARFNDIRNQNTVNSIFDNYTINPDGTVSVRPDTEMILSLQRQLRDIGQDKNKKKKQQGIKPPTNKK